MASVCIESTLNQILAAAANEPQAEQRSTPHGQFGTRVVFADSDDDEGPNESSAVVKAPEVIYNFTMDETEMIDEETAFLEGGGELNITEDVTATTAPIPSLPPPRPLRSTVTASASAIVFSAPCRRSDRPPAGPQRKRLRADVERANDDDDAEVANPVTNAVDTDVMDAAVPEQEVVTYESATGDYGVAMTTQEGYRLTLCERDMMCPEAIAFGDAPLMTDRRRQALHPFRTATSGGGPSRCPPSDNMDVEAPSGDAAEVPQHEMSAPVSVGAFLSLLGSNVIPPLVEAVELIDGVDDDDDGDASEESSSDDDDLPEEALIVGAVETMIKACEDVLSCYAEETAAAAVDTAVPPARPPPSASIPPGAEGSPLQEEPPSILPGILPGIVPDIVSALECPPAPSSPPAGSSARPPPPGLAAAQAFVTKAKELVRLICQEEISLDEFAAKTEPEMNRMRRIISMWQRPPKATQMIVGGVRMDI